MFVTLAMLMMLVPVSYAANSGNCGADNNTYGEGANATWTYDGSGTLTISGTGSVLFRPASSEFNSEWVTKIIVSEGITKLEGKSFDGCTSAKLVYIPSSMQDMGQPAVFNGISFEGIYYGGTQTQWNQLTLPEAFNGVPVFFNANPNNMTPNPTPNPGTVLAPTSDPGGLYDMDTGAGTTTFHVTLPSPSLIMWWKDVFERMGGDSSQYSVYTAEVYVYDANGLLLYHGAQTANISESMNVTLDVPMNILLHEGNTVRFDSHFGEPFSE